MKFVKVIVSIEMQDVEIEARRSNSAGSEDWENTKAELLKTSVTSFLSDWDIAESMFVTVTPVMQNDNGELITLHQEEVTIL
jgi:hypothetical protein